MASEAARMMDLFWANMPGPVVLMGSGDGGGVSSASDRLVIRHGLLLRTTMAVARHACLVGFWADMPLW